MSTRAEEFRKNLIGSVTIRTSPVGVSSLQSNRTVFPDRVCSWILTPIASAKKAVRVIRVLKGVIAAYFPAELDCLRQRGRSSALVLRLGGAGSTIIFYTAIRCRGSLPKSGLFFIDRCLIWSQMSLPGGSDAVMISTSIVSR